jgi:hypothetical protein
VLAFVPNSPCRIRTMFMFVELIILVVLVAVVVIALRPPRQ